MKQQEPEASSKTEPKLENIFPQKQFKTNSKITTEIIRAPKNELPLCEKLNTSPRSKTWSDTNYQK